MPEELLKVLLIEDNPGDKRLVEEELSGRMDIFFDIKTAASLAEAISIATSETVDVVLMDLSLPDSNGIQTFDKFYEHSKRFPIIILSGLKDEKLSLSAVRKGAQDYLVKGEINDITLIKAIRYSIERHKLNDEYRKNKEMLDAVLNNINDLVAIIDLNGKYLYKSPTYDKLQITTNMHDTNIFNEILEDDRETIKNSISEIIKKQSSTLPEYRLLGKEGNIYLLKSYGKTILNLNGKVEKIILISQYTSR